MSNRGKRKNTSSKYKGVTKRYNGYHAQIVSNKINHYLGTFKTEREAAWAYNKAALELFGEYACINKHPELKLI